MSRRRAIQAANLSGMDVTSNFTGSRKVSGGRGPDQADYALTRQAAWWLAIGHRVVRWATALSLLGALLQVLGGAFWGALLSVLVVVAARDFNRRLRAL